MRILFVCTGNTCRSPMAEAYFRTVCRRKGLAVETGSAGLCAYPGDTASEGAARVMAQFGIDLGSFRSTRLTARLAGNCDLVLCMNSGHLAQVRAMGSDIAAKAFRLLDYAGLSGDVADPFGGDENCYLTCFHSMRRALEMLADRFANENSGLKR